MGIIYSIKEDFFTPIAYAYYSIRGIVYDF